jgi:hypothetical protein
VYHIAMHQTAHATGEQRLSLDGQDEAAIPVPLIDGRLVHSVEVWVRAVA